jgi:hypothetical protein
MFDEKEKIGGRFHNVATRELGAALIGMLEQEGQGQNWTAWVITYDGNLYVKRQAHAAPDAVWPSDEKRGFARDLVIRLNREVPYMGAWVVAWFGDQRWAMLWKDHDGDLQVVIFNDEPWARQKGTPIEKWLADAEAGVRKWVAVQEGLALKPTQLHKAALGETPRIIVH